MDKQSRVYVAGHGGLVGSAIVRCLRNSGFENLLLRRSRELDLREQERVREFFLEERPDYVILAAARVGGILANNTYPAEFLYDNLIMQANVIHAAYQVGVKKLLALGSTCIYPKMAPQPLREESLLTGPLEPTNEWYAIAKIAGIKLCMAYHKQYSCNFIAAMPTNLYGPYDNFDLEKSHVLPALMYKFHNAKLAGDKSVTVWGTGKPLREFMHVDDLADACLFLLNNCDGGNVVNIGVGEDISIAELARIIRDVVGFDGEIVYDSSKPDGTPRKLVDVSKINGMGWRAKIGLHEGIAETYKWFLNNFGGLRGQDSNFPE